MMTVVVYVYDNVRDMEHVQVRQSLVRVKKIEIVVIHLQNVSKENVTYS